MQMTITIPDEHVAELETALLKKWPLPGDWPGTTKAWLVWHVRAWIVQQYLHGGQQIAAEAWVPEPGLIAVGEDQSE